MENFVTTAIPSEKPEVKLVRRLWGSFRQYAHNQPCTVSLMTVQPGQRLSLQSHTGGAGLAHFRLGFLDCFQFQISDFAGAVRSARELEIGF